jgi:hypothetical protein
VFEAYHAGPVPPECGKIVFFSTDSNEGEMATKLDKLLKREIDIDGKPYMVTLSPDGVKLTEKGKRKGQGVSWKGLVNGEAATALSLSGGASESDSDSESESAGAEHSGS